MSFGVEEFNANYAAQLAAHPYQTASMQGGRTLGAGQTFIPAGGSSSGNAGGSSSGNAGAPGWSSAASLADPFAPQRAQYQPQLQSLMSGDPTNGYGSQMKTLMTDPTAFSTSDPSYAWRFGQGQQALEASAAAKGMSGSGNVLAAVTQYGQGAASTEYQAQFDRLYKLMGLSGDQFQASYSRLAALSGATTGSPAAAGQIASQEAMFNAKTQNAASTNRQSEAGYAAALQRLSQPQTASDPFSPENYHPYVTSGGEDNLWSVAMPTSSSGTSNVVPSYGSWSDSSGGGGYWGSSGYSSFGGATGGSSFGGDFGE